MMPTFQLVHLIQRWKTLVYASLCTAMLVSLAACGASTDAVSLASKPVQYTTIAGTTFDSASLKGKVTLVNFWATSCTTCVKEMPMMVQQFKTFETQGYRHIAVAMDYDSVPFVKQFAAERALPFDVVHDADGKIAQAFGNVKLTPTTFLIDRQGAIVKRYVGAPKEAELSAAIAQLIAKS